MDKLICSWSDGKTLPENYVFPAEKRPGELVVPTSKSVPVIDLSEANGANRVTIIQKIVKASQDFGFFQVINHGVPKKVLNDTRAVFKETFELPTEEKAKFCSSDTNQKFIIVPSNIDYEKEDIHNWRDSLRICCAPLEESMQGWPQKPDQLRVVLRGYTIEVRELGSRILELISEGLGLEKGYFGKEFSEEQILAVHHYPPCPDPSLTLGTRSHCDTGLITILMQGDVPGLQVLKDGKWIGVEAVPDAFVVNIGYALQLVSNGKFVSVEHRVVTNRTQSRISAAFFISPAEDYLLEPAKGIANDETPPIYKGVRYGELLKTFRAAYVGKIDSVLENYMIKA